MTAKTPPVFVRVSTDSGHHTMPAAIAARDKGLRVLQQDALDPATGRPLPFKPREELGTPQPAAKKAARKRAAKKAAAEQPAPKLRDETAAATPTEPEAAASGDTPKE